MRFPSLLPGLLLAFSLLLSPECLYSAPDLHGNHIGQDEQPEKAPTFHYVCPMHADVTSKKPGKCRKCKMKLEKKRIKPPAAKPMDQ